MQLSSLAPCRMNFRGQIQLKSAEIKSPDSDEKHYASDLFITSEQISGISRPASDKYTSVIRMNNGDTIFLKNCKPEKIANIKSEIDGTSTIKSLD